MGVTAWMIFRPPVKPTRARLALGSISASRTAKLKSSTGFTRHGIPDGIIINPAAFTHTSVAILDALVLTELPVVEVHISNIFRRESFRQHSYISMGATGIISGFGAHGYALAIDAMMGQIGAKKEK